MDFIVGLFFHHAIYFNASVGANSGAGGAADTFVGVFGISVVVAAIINLLGLEGEDIHRTRHNTQVATFAALFIDGDSSEYLWHNIEL